MQETSRVLRYLGHPGLRKKTARVGRKKVMSEDIQSMFQTLVSVMQETGMQSISAPQCGFPYQLFAMKSVFFDDFNEQTDHLEQIINNDDPSNWEAMEAYCMQMENKLMMQDQRYESELKELERMIEEQQRNQQHSSHWLDSRQRIELVVNPQWHPLSEEWTQQPSQTTGLSGMHRTMMFGLADCDNRSSNFESCASIPNLMVRRTRVNRIQVKFLDGRTGEERSCHLKSNDSRLFQHECDRLRGLCPLDGAEEIIHTEEYLRRQAVLRPRIEDLCARLSGDQTEALYSRYDPLHPPCDEDLLRILHELIQESKLENSLD